MTRKKRKKKRINWAWIRFASFYFTLIVLAVVIFIAGRLDLAYRVSGTSMEPTLYNGDICLSSRIKNPEDIKRGDIVCAFMPGTKEMIVKRIVGLPGEYVEVNKHQIVEINGEELEESYLDKNNLKYDYFDYRGDKRRLKDDEVFVMGDNRNISFDGRYFGPIKIKDIQMRFKKRIFTIHFLKMTR